MEALKDLEKYVDDAVAHFMTIMQTRQNQDTNIGLFVQLFAFGELPTTFYLTSSQHRQDVIGGVQNRPQSTVCRHLTYFFR